MSRNAGKRERDRKARHALTFGLEADAVRQGPCVAMRNFEGPGKRIRCRVRQAVIDDELQLVWDPAHIVSVGAGGGRFDMISLCSAHHRQQHDMGIGTFAALYGLDLRALADEQALAPEPPLGIRGLAARWAYHEAGAPAYGEISLWLETTDTPKGYGLAALMAWVRREADRQLASQQGDLPLHSRQIIAMFEVGGELQMPAELGRALCEQAGWPS